MSSQPLKVCFHIPRFVGSCCQEKSRLWVDFIRETAKSFKANPYIISTGESEPEAAIRKYAIGQGCIIVKCLEELEGEKVYLHEAGSDLNDFVHPSEKSVYIMGLDDGQSAEAPVRSVAVNTGTGYSLWSAVALGIVLNDRNRKIVLSETEEN